MSTKFNSAQNTSEKKKQQPYGKEQSSLARPAAKAEAGNDSELNIQDLLKKYPDVRVIQSDISNTLDKTLKSMGRR